MAQIYYNTIWHKAKVPFCAEVIKCSEGFAILLTQTIALPPVRCSFTTDQIT
jgi:hypothetical protein